MDRRRPLAGRSRRLRSAPRRLASRAQSLSWPRTRRPSRFGPPAPRTRSVDREADREAGLRPPGSTRRQPGRGQSRGPSLPSSVFFSLGPLDDRDRVGRTCWIARRLDRRRAAGRAIGRVERAAQARPAGELVVGGVGLVLGLGAAALATFAVRPLPYVGRYLLLPLALVLGYVRGRRCAQPRLDPAPRRPRQRGGRVGEGVGPPPAPARARAPQRHAPARHARRHLRDHRRPHRRPRSRRASSTASS